MVRVWEEMAEDNRYVRYWGAIEAGVEKLEKYANLALENPTYVLAMGE
jgi:hypothetical protein